MMARTEGLAADEGLVMHMATTLHSNTVDAHRLLAPRPSRRGGHRRPGAA